MGRGEVGHQQGWNTTVGWGGRGWKMTAGWEGVNLTAIRGWKLTNGLIGMMSIRVQ